MYFYFTIQTCSESTLKALRKLYKSSPKAGSPKALRKRALQNLRKQAGFVESPSKAS